MEDRLNIRELNVGFVLTGSRSFTAEDIADFCRVTRDRNLLHYDEEFMRSTRFGRPIVPGLLVASLFADIASHYDLIAQDIALAFKAPVFVGETINASIRVTARQDAVLVGDFECRTSEGRLVLEGRLMGLALSAIMKKEDISP